MRPGYFPVASCEQATNDSVALRFITGDAHPDHDTIAIPWDEWLTPPCPEDADAVTAMAHRLRTAEGKAIYAKRTSTVETVFGVIKYPPF